MPSVVASRAAASRIAFRLRSPSLAYQLLGAVAIVVGLAGTWCAARSRQGWLLCIASTVLWLPALMTGGQWTAVGNCALSIDICLRNFLVQPARIRRRPGSAPHGPAERAEIAR